MLNKTVLCALCAFSLLTIGLTSAFAFTVKNEDFSAEFPSQPQFERKNFFPNGIPTERRQWLADLGDDGGAFLVSVQKPLSTDGKNVQIVDYDRDVGVWTQNRGSGAKLVVNRAFQLQGVTGREIVIDEGAIVQTVRFIHVNLTAYTIGVAGRPGIEKSATAEAFLNSFQIAR